MNASWGLGHFQASRLSATANGEHFMDWSELMRQLHVRLGPHTYLWPHEVNQALNALQRVMQEVSTILDGVLATHHVITLHELDGLVMNMTNSFREVDSFGGLMLGPLHAHPKVRTYFAKARLPPPAVTSQELLAHIAVRLEEHWDTPASMASGPERFLAVEPVLADFAARHEYSSIEEMGIIVRLEKLVTGLVARCMSALWLTAYL